MRGGCGLHSSGLERQWDYNGEERSEAQPHYRRRGSVLARGRRKRGAMRTPDALMGSTGQSRSALRRGLQKQARGTARPKPAGQPPVSALPRPPSAQSLLKTHFLKPF
ncbi:hypothetical protein SKAU_G00356450 [Synaphobranchus kaupii]|uniref:Uncharacterized protein n=1 Tax=Synaphobranchus kaupii TaxID=118154 RepID=A0A9Q1EHF4_SYNKA|nr:hypothetical protein SKAU_G00356450 [Synaphobranchus kaupii]